MNALTACSLALLTVSLPLPAQEAPTQETPGGLAKVFEPGYARLDKNGDGQTDYLSLRIVLPDQPLAGEVAAAAALAARMGFETSGLDLPLVFAASELAGLDDDLPTIVIGKSNPMLPEDLGSRIEELKDGQGLAVFRAGHVYIAGKDDTGTQTAGEAFAMRSPYLWRVIGREEGATFERMQRDLSEVLGTADVDLQSMAVESLLYQKDLPEVQRASIRAALAPADEAKALEQLEALRSQQSQGLRSELLNYGDAAELRVVVGARSVDLPRIGLPSRFLNPPRRPPTRFARPPSRGARGGRGRGEGGAEPRPAGRGNARGRRFDLGQLYSRVGLLRDGDGDRIPDDTNLMIVYPATAKASPGIGAAQLAARIGLESTGLSMPFFGFDSELKHTSAEARPLVLMGRENKFVQELRQIGKLREEPPAAGVGRIEIVPDAYRGNSAVAVHGGDPAGEAAAADYLARRLPNLWQPGRGEASIGEVAESLRKFLSGRSTAAQAAVASYLLDEALDEIEGKMSKEEKDLASISVQAFLDETAADFAPWMQARVQARFPNLKIEASSRRRSDPEPVFEQKPELAWEVDRFWQRFRSQVLDSIEAAAVVDLELRVSEAPELRRELAVEIRTAIEAAGGKVGELRVLSAYKQGFSWLVEEIAPALAGKPVSEIEIGWQPIEIDRESKQRFHNEPARWVNELYPVDDILARDLELPLESIRFVAREADATYSVLARDAQGEILLERSFSPKHYERPYMQAYPEYATLMVCTGWIDVSVNGEQNLNERLPTDSDLIWDHYQNETLKAVKGHIEKSSGGKPTQDKAPYFHTLRIEVQASEPDYRLGIDEEHISVLESLHDDFYFDSLDLFAEMARVASGDENLNVRRLAAGNVLPWIHPERRGQAPSLTLSYSAYASKEPKLVVSYRFVGDEVDAAAEKPDPAETKDPSKPEAEEKEKDREISKLIKPIQIPLPTAWLAEVESGREELARLGFLVELDKGEHLPRLAKTVDGLARLQAAGLFENELGHVGLAKISLRIEAPGALMMRNFASRPAAVTQADLPAYSENLVSWQEVIGPEESERIAHTLGTLPAVNTHVAGQSYRGRPISVLEIFSPMEAELVSQAKLNTWKPVLSLIGRQHANEVSSTSHILRLAERLATDPEYQPYLKHMNVVMQPTINPDGAAIAYELQKLTPNHCLHAGRYSVLGQDVGGRGTSDRDSLLTERLVMGKVERRWIADISLNPHGYPSHEWVHQFGNYNPKSFRSYWIPRGWYTVVRPSEDPRLKAYREVTLAMMDYIDEELSKDAGIKAINKRIYDRYNRWAIRRQPHLYNLDIHGDTAIYNKRRSGNTSVASGDAMLRPTAFSGMTEAMDETAQGPWLDRVARMGFGFLMASVRFLEEADDELYRMEGERGIGVRLALTRPRPIAPGKGR